MSMPTLANKPDQDDLHLGQFEESKVSCIISQEEDYNTFIIKLEDHTIGNLINTQLYLDPEVTFSAYRVPHPLIHEIEVVIRPSGYTGVKLLSSNVNHLKNQVVKLKKEFLKKVHSFKKRHPYNVLGT